MHRVRFGSFVVLCAIASVAPLAGQWKAPRTPFGHPDLQGIWNAATITPLERPAELKGKATLTEAEATAWANEFLENSSLDRRDGGPERDRSRAYPNYFVDRGTGLARVGNLYRTSLVVDPADGRIPPLTAEGKARTDRDNAQRRTPPNQRVPRASTRTAIRNCGRWPSDACFPSDRARDRRASPSSTTISSRSCRRPIT